jgi:predicted secreted protein
MIGSVALLFTTATMTRANRVALWLAIFLVAYFLTLFAFLPVPFFSKEHAEEILPVVRPVARCRPCCTLKLRLVTLVAAHLLRFILTLVTRTWPLHIPRMHGRVYGVVERKSRASHR